MLMIISALCGGVAATIFASIRLRGAAAPFAAVMGALFAAIGSYVLGRLGAVSDWALPLSEVLTHLGVGVVSGGLAGALVAQILRTFRDEG
ncbi:MAG: hypothetical protein AAF913_07075 [Pseudomonadota bacterium]